LSLAPLAAGLLLAGPAHAASKPCQLKEYASMPVGFMNALPYVTVNINGHMVRMVLDLGSYTSTLFDGVVAKLGLRKQPLPFFGSRPEINGKAAEEFTVPQKFVLGGLAADGLQLVVQPAGPMPSNLTLETAIVGRFSPSALSGVDVELYLAHGKLNLFQSTACKGAYWSDQYATATMRQGSAQDWYYDMELDGKKLQTKFITTDRDTYIYTVVTKSVYGWDQNSPAVQVSRDATGQERYRYRAMALKMPGLSILNAPIILNPQVPCGPNHRLSSDMDDAAGFAECGNVAPPLIGTNVLRQLRLYMAMRQRTLYFPAADAH
jgi:hypothetical protein